MKKNYLLNSIAALLISIPLIYLIHILIPKYEGEIIIESKNNKFNISIDLDKDGKNEKIQFEIINGDNDLYCEVWSDKSLLGLWRKTSRLIKGTVQQADINQDNKDEILFFSIENDSIFGNALELEYINDQLEVNLIHRIFVLKIEEKEADLFSFKSMAVDLDEDGSPELIANINFGIKIRGIYSVNYAAKKAFICAPPYLMVTDFQVEKINATNQIIVSTYANGNIPQTRVKDAAILFGLDSTIADSYLSDCHSQVFILNNQLEIIAEPKVFGEMFSMQRPVYLKKTNQILSLQSGISETDTIEVLRLFDDQLNLLKENNVKFPYDKSLMTKYNAKILYPINVNNEERILFVANNDSILEVDIDSLTIRFFAYFPEVKSNAHIMSYDLDKDGINEILFSVDNGVYITRPDLSDGIFLPTEGKIDFKKQFRYTHPNDKQQGVKTISNRNHYLILYRFNSIWYLKWVFMTLSIVLALLMLFWLQKIQVKKLNEKNIQLENIVQQRTLEISLQKTLLEEKNTEILDSINYAKRIQNAILPPGRIVKEYLQQSFILYKPKDIVAGDFYWLEVTTPIPPPLEGAKGVVSNEEEQVIFFAAADCTGHGVPGAMVSVICNNGLNRSVREYHIKETGKILDKTREIVIQEFEKSDEEVKDGMDISICGLNLATKQLQWSGANNPLWLIRNGELIEYKPDKQPIGKFEHPEPFTTHIIDLIEGDTIYIFTDGFADQFGGEKGKKFMYKPFKNLLLEIQPLDMMKQKEVIEQTFEDWKSWKVDGEIIRETEQIDDVCIIGFRL
jgi:serine phosphatase RsbU (regulator of sigma subunit)